MTSSPDRTDWISVTGIIQGVSTPQSPTAVGEWLVESLIATGGSAAIYSATHPRLGRGALKVLHPHLLHNASHVERLRREAEITSSLEHPSVPRILDCGHAHSIPYFAMELLDGESLDMTLKRSGKLAPGLVYRVLLAVLDVLERCHQRGIVHRDIKPGNIQLLAKGEIKLLDFGVAREIGPGELTGLGMSVGTPAYMPPEQALGSPEDLLPSSDIFSLALTAMVLLKGGPLRTFGFDIGRVIEPVPPSSELGLEGPKELLAVLDRAAQQQPGQRYPSAESMKLALLSAASQPGPHTVSTTDAVTGAFDFGEDLTSVDVAVTLPVSTNDAVAVASDSGEDLTRVDVAHRALRMCLGGRDLVNASSFPQARRAASGGVTLLAAFLFGISGWIWGLSRSPDRPPKAVMNEPMESLARCPPNARRGPPRGESAANPGAATPPPTSPRSTATHRATP